MDDTPTATSGSDPPVPAPTQDRETLVNEITPHEPSSTELTEWDVVSLVSSADPDDQVSASQEWSSDMALHVLWSGLTRNITRRVRMDCEHYAHKDSRRIVAQVYQYTLTVEEYLAIAGRGDSLVTLNSVLAYLELLSISSPGLVSYSTDCSKVTTKVGIPSLTEHLLQKCSSVGAYHFHLVVRESGQYELLIVDLGKSGIWFMTPIRGRVKGSNPIHPEDENFVRTILSVEQKSRFVEPIVIAVDVPTTDVAAESAIFVMTFARMVINGYYPVAFDVLLARTRICWELRQQAVGSKE